MLSKENRLILSIAIPAALNNLLDMLQILIDMLFVGRISPQAIAGVGLSMQLVGFLYAFITVFSVGTNAVVAQFIGARSNLKAQATTYTSLIFAFLVSIPFTLITFLYSFYFFSLFTQDKEIVQNSTDYMKILSVSIPFLFVGAVLTASSNGKGDTKTPFIIGISGNILNTFLDYVLILGNLGFPRLEVVGAGIATTVSYIFEVILYFVLIYKKKVLKITPVFSKRILDKILKIGVPSGIERIIIYGSFMFFVWIIGQYGAYVLAGYQIGLRVEGIAFMPGFGFAIAAMTLVGQSVGEKDLKKAKRVGLKIAYIAGFVMQFIGVFLFLYPEFFVSFFTEDKETIKQASLYLQIVAVSQFPLAVDFVLSGALRGAGASKMSLAINTLCLWLFRLIPSLIITLTFKDLKLVYFFMVFETFIKGFVIWYIFKKGMWIKGGLKDA